MSEERDLLGTEAPDQSGPALALVVAVAENGVIGRDNHLPWRLRTDLRRFKALTLGKPMIMGRRCWDSIGRPLPGRETVALSRDPGFRPAGAHAAADWEAAVATAGRLAHEMGVDEVAVVGGAEIYRLALPHADALHLTTVHARPEGDVLFPSYPADDFVEIFRERHEAGPEDEYPFTFVDLVRRSARKP